MIENGMTKNNHPNINILNVLGRICLIRQKTDSV